MKTSAKFLGREAVVKRLKQLVPDVEEQVAEAQMEGAQELANRIKPRTPGPVTGEYLASIQADRIANRANERAVGTKSPSKDKNATGVFANFIWRFLEFGTVKMSARPHIFPTYRAYRKRLRRKIAGAVNKAVRKAKQK